MITPESIATILKRDCESIGITEIYPAVAGDNGDSDDIPTGDIKTERIVIYVKPQQPGKYWKKNFNEINIYVPTYMDRANRIRLEELERKAMKLFDDVVNSYDGTAYRYSIDSIGTEADTALKCHYVNVRILFEVLNVKL